ncbi:MULTISPECIES: sugar ABC transporter ATP-binding protein [Burkholderia]|jgi:ribose transport system ATP-binding protein|uniref:Sugar ABC transporter ATP-binding protein n=5 Tax=Burkholderia cenocepacia TaxID=95486 RepID=A0A1V2X570_9BURK|nr:MULTISPECIES: sugar ABC transporter ATP-binding protein [Burkholderia]KIS50060.1 ABC transporter family protein [Burkholderia cepacia]AOK37558.1 sugar ABC transporter ATP-binding protein [Burkholderia cenocepacia]AQQ38118.1 sugar ABC transporter ATP-binding protein [Burkholderia cenocepacia]EPZ88207.1 ABC transporter, ATP-binding protein [Burkholderia cenocepacia K56-2Valvano]KKI80178.1 sugar ABC transporter ATP-binding protein [Burkholderia cenocepacia]
MDATLPAGPGADSGAHGQPVVLETHGVGKTFGVVRALNGVSLSLRAGEVHGLMGENGAGKSTLIKILTGFHQPDAGEIRVDGVPVSFDSPRAAQRAGICAVYQEINLIPERSVAENIFLGHEPRRFGPWIDRRAMRARTREIVERYGLDVDPADKVGSLGLGQQQMVSIARGVSLGARVLILDEPTSALSGAEVEVLFGVVEQLRATGIAIVLVSHRLSECYRMCDRLTVLRDGAVVRSESPDRLPRMALIAAMLGREVGAHGPREQAETVAADTTREPALAVDGLRWGTRLRDVSFRVAPKEIVGLAGLLGAGRTETFKAVFGAQQPDGGAVRVGGRALDGADPARAIRAGLAFLSEDRRSEGIFSKLSVRENIVVCVLPRIARFGFISVRKQEALVERYIRELGIKTSHAGAPISTLSGGNQQKALIARCLSTEPSVLLLDDPTRGIDVGAKAEVHDLVKRLADDGLAVVATSSEMEELLELADRLVILHEGATSGELPTRGASPDDVTALLANQT